MAEGDNVQWYAMGILVSVATPTALYIWNSCCGSFCSGLHSWLFQMVAKKFEVCENRFEGVSNIAAITRVLKALGLRTYRFRWQHDANADTNDSYQVGTVRLPTRSWCIWLLALLGITHYIWVKEDGSAIVMTGPQEAVKVLLKVSNLAANRQPKKAELDELRATIGFGSTDASTDRCVLIERLFFFIFMLACSPTFRYRKDAYGQILFISCGALSCCGLAWTLWFSLTTGSILFRLRAVYEAGKRRLFRHFETENACTLELQLHATALLDVEDVENRMVAQEERGSQQDRTRTVSFDGQDQVAERVVARSAERRYSLVVARSCWYEVHCQYSMEPGFAADLPTIEVTSQPLLLAMNQRPDLSKVIAHRICAGDDLLYLCVHNPMTDLHIVEMKELLTKADRGIALVVMLPAMEHWDRALETSVISRLHADKESRYVTTLADLSAWLSILNMGVFLKVLLILPYHERSSLKSSPLWKMAVDTMKSEIR